MTETYNGPWSSIAGDVSRERAEDPYHPRYPDAGSYQKTEAVNEQSVVEVGGLVAAGISEAQVTG